MLALKAILEKKNLDPYDPSSFKITLKDIYDLQFFKSLTTCKWNCLCPIYQIDVFPTQFSVMSVKYPLTEWALHFV